jgi:hypothetical protein
VAVVDGAADLLGQRLVEPRHPRLDVKPEARARQTLRARVAGEKKLLQRFEHPHGLGARRQGPAVEVVNLHAVARVRFDERGGCAADLLVHRKLLAVSC